MRMQFEYRQMFSDMATAMFEPASDEMNLGIKEYRADSGKPHLDAAYRCIHLRPEEFIEMLARVELQESFFVSDKKSRAKFLDVGCGVGQKVFLAHAMGLDAYGLEIREKHADKARQLLKQYILNDERRAAANESIITGDAITFDRYAEFDFIYFYCPSHVNEVEEKIEMAVAQGAKVGAIVLPRGHIFAQNSGNEYQIASLGWKAFSMAGETYYKRISKTPVGLTKTMVAAELHKRGWSVLREYDVKEKTNPNIGKLQKVVGGPRKRGFDLRRGFVTMEEAVKQEGLHLWKGSTTPDRAELEEILDVTE